MSRNLNELQRVRVAQAQIKVVLLDLQNEHNLTDLDMLQALNDFAATALRYMQQDAG